MTGEQYLTTQMRLIEIGKIANSLDLTSFLKAISNAEAVAPVLDPTLYRRAADNMAAIRKLAESVVPVKTAFEQTFKAVLETTLMGDMTKS